MKFEDYAREAGRALSASGRTAEVPAVKEMWARHRRRGLILGSAAAAILAAGTIGIVAAVGGLGGDDGEVANGSASPMTVPAATVPVEGGAVMFGPPRIERADEVEFPITLLDGTRLTLTLPRSLAEDVRGLVPGGTASWELNPCCARSLEVIYGSVDDLYGERPPDVEYEDADGNPVAFYTEDDALDHLVFQYGSWVVRAWDGDAEGRRFTDENREMFASLMRGHETSEGFLVLDPAEPMSIGPTDSPDATLTTRTPEEGLVGIFNGRECASEGPSADPDLVTSAGNLVSFAEESGMTSICFQESALYVWVSRLDLSETELEAIELTYLSEEPEEVSTSALEGRLPDGTSYRLEFSPQPAVVELAGPVAAIVLDLEDDPETRQQLGCVNQCRAVAIGITRFTRGPTPTSFEQRTFSISSGDWTMSVNLSQDILALWGDQAEAILTQSIIPLDLQGGLPAFEIVPPLRWATDTEIPLQMEVDYGSFVVRRGCGDLSVGCSASGAVQVIPAEKVTAPSPPWDYETIVTVTEPPTTTATTTTTGPTPTSMIQATGPWSVVADHPVVGRVFPIVVWTGNEVIVWGGEKPSEAAWHADGAAFDPATGTWRDLADSPLAPRTEHVAVWTGEEVIICCGRIVGGGARAAAYNPEADVWREIEAPPISPAFAEAIWTGEEMLVFGGIGGGGTSNLVGAAAYNPVTDSWRRLADLPYGLERVAGSTLGDGVVYAWASFIHFTVDREDRPPLVYDLASDEWQRLPPPPGGAPSSPSLTWTGDKLFAYGAGSDAEGNDIGIALIYEPGNQAWSLVPQSPLDPVSPSEGTEGSQSAVWADGEVYVWAGSEGPLTPVVAYDPSLGSWRELEPAPIPGQGAWHAPIIWTGSLLITYTDPMLSYKP